MNLKDKVALVTGAARGIGGDIALALAREKVHVPPPPTSRNPRATNFKGSWVRRRKSWRYFRSRRMWPLALR